MPLVSSVIDLGFRWRDGGDPKRQVSVEEGWLAGVCMSVDSLLMSVHMVGVGVMSRVLIHASMRSRIASRTSTT